MVQLYITYPVSDQTIIVVGYRLLVIIPEFREYIYKYIQGVWSAKYKFVRLRY